MAVSSRDNPKPVRRKVVIDVPELGGEVIVQAMTLTERLKLNDVDYWDQIPQILAVSVINPDGKPFYSEEEWENFGSSDDAMLACLKLVKAAKGLASSEKKAATPEAEPSQASAV